MDPQYMLTTTDNPFNPFRQFDEWYAFDEAMGYHTCGLLARFTITSDELSDSDQELSVQQAIDEIIQDNFTGIHKKVTPSDFKN